MSSLSARRKSENGWKRWDGDGIDLQSKSMLRSEAEDAFCEAEPRLAKQGLHIVEDDMARDGAKRPAGGVKLSYKVIKKNAKKRPRR